MWNSECSPSRLSPPRRFNTFHHQDSFDPNPDRAATVTGPGKMRVNKTVSDEVLRELEKRGHKVSTTGGAIAYPVMIYIDHGNNMIYAAGDPKAGRHAAAID